MAQRKLGRRRRLAAELDARLRTGAQARQVAAVQHEHAYFLDYRTDRAAYIDAFFENLDWATVNNWVSGYSIPLK